MGLFSKNRNDDTRIVVLSSNELLRELVGDYSRAKQSSLMQVRSGIITREAFLKDVSQNIDFMYKVEPEVKEEGMALFEDFIFGYSRLTDLIDDPEVSDIHCIAYNNIRIKKKGKRMDSGVSFESAEEYANFINFVAAKNEVNTSNLNAIQRFADNESHEKYILRFTLSMPIINTYDEPYLVIRKVPKDFPLMDDLVKEEMMSQELCDILKQRFVDGSCIICGSNSSGKTTILNALKECIPENRSVLVAQQADELTTKAHPDMFFLHSLPGNSESSLQYDLQNISIAGLTMDIDYFVIGEVKGAEARYLLNAAYTGQICSATIHAPSADKAIDKIVDYALLGGSYTKEEMLKMMDCFKTVVFMKGYKVNQVYAVKGYDEEKGNLKYEPIWENGGFANGYNSKNAVNA